LNFLRVQFQIWPGQNSLIDTTFRQQMVAAMKSCDPDYADWQVVITYRADERQNIIGFGDANILASCRHNFAIANHARHNKLFAAMEFAVRMENRLMFSADDSYE